MDGALCATTVAAVLSTPPHTAQLIIFPLIIPSLLLLEEITVETHFLQPSLYPPPALPLPLLMGGGASLHCASPSSVEDQIRRNLVDHGNEGLILHTILFDNLARSTFFEFLDEGEGSHFISLYLDIINCKLIDETHFKGEQDNLDFFDKLVSILNENMRYLNELADVKEEVRFLLKNASQISRKEATEALVRIERGIVNHVKPWFPYFERSKTFAEYRNYNPSALFPTKLEPTAKVRRRGHSLTKYFENAFNTTHGANFYADQEVLILERGSITSKILIRSLQPYFKGATHVHTPQEAAEALSQKLFHVILVSVEPDYLTGVEVVGAYLKAIQSFNGENGSLQNLCVDGEKFKFDDLANGKMPQIRPPVVLGMTVCRDIDFKREICDKGFKAVLSRPFTLGELLTAKGDHSITSVVANFTAAFEA